MGTTNIIRARRRELGLSIDELGLRAGIERSRLSRAERGYVHLNHDELTRLALHLGLEADHLVSAVPASIDEPSSSPAGGAS